MRPLIGISCRMEKRDEGDWFYLQREYSEAVLAAGGIPVMLPLLAEPEYALALAERLDAIVLPGSRSDVDPERYGANPHPKLGPVHRERDQLDAAFIHQALERHKPLLGICFGTQMLNVAMGGSLVQHLETGIPHSDRKACHVVQVEAGSLLARLGGAGEHQVNTSHHQALERVPAALRITARAPDGVIEAVETTEPDRFLLGVQWHPERIWQKSPISRALFEELVRRSVRQ